MNKRASLFFLALFLPCEAWAGRAPKVEVFGGYSYFRANISNALQGAGFVLPSDFNMHGWAGSATLNLNRWAGVVADFSGHYAEVVSLYPTGELFQRYKVHNFLVGPRLKVRRWRFEPFSHALFGVSRGDVDFKGQGTLNNTKLAVAFGGGVDLQMTESIALRLVQADYLLTRYGRENSGQRPILCWRGLQPRKPWPQIGAEHRALLTTQTGAGKRASHVVWICDSDFDEIRNDLFGSRHCFRFAHPRLPLPLSGWFVALRVRVSLV